MGCNAGEKCTWFHDDMSDPPIGHIGCATTGTVAVGGACVYGTPGATGFDDCAGGSVCVGGVCEAICDQQGGAPMCATNFGCVRISGLFGAVGSTTPPAGGVCEPSCNPLADNDYDGSAAGDVRTGSACGTDPAVGCYGNITDSGGGTHFICAGPAATAAGTTEDLVHRNVIPDDLQYLNSCHPGYTIAFASDGTATMKVACYSYCAPGNSFGSMGTSTTLPPATQLPNGIAPNACKTGAQNRGRAGDFGAVPNGVPGALLPGMAPAPAGNKGAGGPGTNGEHCMFSWQFEVDDAMMLHRTATSDTLGLCFDHTKYGPDDYDGNPDAVASPDSQMPACSNLKLKDDVQFDATNAGCVDSVTAGFPAAAIGKAVKGTWTEKDRRFRAPLIVPAFNRDFSLPFSYPTQSTHQSRR
ncbi:MAG: hypothetical protein H0T79_14625 [Deltaproteobacteria bacterium]|nr:hypothetical protein [Deltaproteobacteria bacterium]